MLARRSMNDIEASRCQQQKTRFMLECIENGSCGIHVTMQRLIWTTQIDDLPNVVTDDIPIVISSTSVGFITVLLIPGSPRHGHELAFTYRKHRRRLRNSKQVLMPKH